MINKQPQQDAPKHALHIAILVFAGTIGLSLLTGVFVQRASFLAEFDAGVYELLSMTLPHTPWLNALVKPFNYNFLPWGGLFIPSFLIVMMLAFLGWMYFKKRELFPWAVATAALGVVYGNLLYEITSSLIFRARPFTVLPHQLDQVAINAWQAWSSYPSGHTRDTAMYATIISSYLPKLTPLMILLAIFVGFTRVYVGAHYPTDVLGGLLIGFLAGKVVLLFTRELQILVERRKVRGEHGATPKP